MTTTAQITLGAGCFWCVEAQFSRLKGVKTVEPGYAGGIDANTTYEEVCTGKTGHAEVVQVTYDPETLSLTRLLEVFFRAHDPTTLNRQGADVGTQYRSVIFYADDQQKLESQNVVDRLQAEGIYPDPIVTTLEPLKNYSAAEAYHQNYFLQNPDKAYCRMVIQPKVEKFQAVFKDLLDG